MWRRAASILLLSCSVWAAAPSLDGLFPAGAPRDRTNIVTLLGKFDPWPPKIWATGEGLTFNFETNKGKVQVIVASNSLPGPRLLRLFNEDGASEPAFFVVEDGRSELEAEPNDHFRKPQVLTNLPLTLAGRLEKNEDVDSFAINLKAGEWLDARLESYVMMSKLDPVLRAVTTNGFQLAWNHDFGSLDPRLIWRSPKDQTVILQVFGFVYPANASIQLSGGSGGFYRAHLSVSSRCPIPPLGAESNEIAFGQAVAGTICPSGNIDKYRARLKKDQWVELRAEAFAIGSPLDPWVSVENTEGKELARNDDAEGTRDPVLEWKAPDDGEYLFCVGSVTRTAREDFRYLLTLRELAPGYQPKASAQSILIKAGETNQVKFTAKRLRGFTNELAACFGSLPEGLACSPVTLDAKTGEATLQLIAATNAPAWQGPVKLLVKDNSTGAEKLAGFDLVSRTVDNGVPGGYSKLLIETVDDLWLTVQSAAEKKE